jgi:hypothetical protein
MPAVAENEETEADEEDAKGGATLPQRRGQGGEVKRSSNGRGERQTIIKGEGDDEKEGESEVMKKDGLKLRIELDLDVELELKAKINGSITLALLFVSPPNPFSGRGAESGYADECCRS